MAFSDLSVHNAPTTTYADEELAAGADRTSAALRERLPDDSVAEEFAADFDAGRDELHAAGVKNLANPETDNRRDADQERDRAFLSFRLKVESMQYSPNQRIVEASFSILEVVEKRGYSMHNDGLAKQTSAMDGLILDLQTPEMVVAMESIGVKSEFDALVRAMDSYKQTDRARVNAAASIEAKSVIDARKSVRVVIEECYWWLHRRLRKNPEQFAPMVRRWNEIFSELTASAKARQSRESGDSMNTASISPAL
jgi:hypothetical protein